MKKVSKDFVIEWVQRIPDEDEKFLRQLYTIIKKHLERTESISFPFLFANSPRVSH